MQYGDNVKAYKILARNTFQMPVCRRNDDDDDDDDDNNNNNINHLKASG